MVDLLVKDSFKSPLKEIPSVVFIPGEIRSNDVALIVVDNNVIINATGYPKSFQKEDWMIDNAVILCIQKLRAQNFTIVFINCQDNFISPENMLNRLSILDDVIEGVSPFYLVALENDNYQLPNSDLINLFTRITKIKFSPRSFFCSTGLTGVKSGTTDVPRKNMNELLSEFSLSVAPSFSFNTDRVYFIVAWHPFQFVDFLKSQASKQVRLVPLFDTPFNPEYSYINKPIQITLELGKIPVVWVCCPRFEEREKIRALYKNAVFLLFTKHIDTRFSNSSTVSENIKHYTNNLELDSDLIKIN